jgi:hypothetical protein
MFFILVLSSKHSFSHLPVGGVANVFAFVLVLSGPITQHACVLTLTLGPTDDVAVGSLTPTSTLGSVAASATSPPGCHLRVPLPRGLGSHLFRVPGEVHSGKERIDCFCHVYRNRNKFLKIQ